VAFDEPLEDASAVAIANYAINGGVTVTSATVVSAPNTATAVRLATTGSTPGQS
jgi:hypothetical protein